ncbi:uncharacterized protein BO97DRAFT_225272 [Aspergillus homomorphus CBS 101889]|uniref:Uncharacterized protein n=1 Tax=Aspergillus homomorphus (strain CBS 101889) TaxID=1450537 RepID=A0A395HKL8_ASPHC|nr:hypothetical protein BO97DRAFT_225272 [Aspergillus homomorphus CBS 101889]RAL08156.1 hypothetical protein BO97DRAFT_225272 [Aspergillus homomorphus CBS 101889]
MRARRGIPVAGWIPLPILPLPPPSSCSSAMRWLHRDRDLTVETFSSRDRGNGRSHASHWGITGRQVCGSLHPIKVQRREKPRLMIPLP